ncbi:MAG: hypothetical protein H6865_02730 [Rhodospirillales bacterium]|nr:hypothetical protein [Alphaproteobacteria bacterium]MCB9986532.1 hypothetical protein [Rhodospirillales bacterium]USO06932.1 MAG: hypothetical protein H6866_05655 [Rhodospirillales bacterium]
MERNEKTEPLSLSDQLRAAAAQAQDAAKGPEADPDTIRQNAFDDAMRGTFTQDVRDTVEAAGKVARTVSAAFNMAAQAWQTIRPILGPLPRWGKAFYNRAAYRKNADGTRTFSPKRSAVAAAFIAAGVWYGAPLAWHTAIGVTTGVVEFAKDAVVYHMTAADEDGYFQTPTLVDPKDPDNRAHRVSVCESKDKCGPEDIQTYLIRDSYYFDFLEIAKSAGKMLTGNFSDLQFNYYPDYVSGSVTAPGIHCKFTSWGPPRIKALRKNLAEPKIHLISCDKASYSLAPK